MNQTPSSSLDSDRRIFIAAGLCALVAGLFVLFTQHAWEDYYITFRASKNLADGHGLVFTPGERVHSFTSPIGVLLPALTSWLTGGESDQAALWLFRVLSIGALGGAVALVFSATSRLKLHPITPWLGAALVMFEAKIVDFSTNGMETAFLLLFTAGALHAMLKQGPRQFLQLGVAWAGMMWSRPDSFIYITLLGIGYGAFGFFDSSQPKFKDRILLMLKAAGVCAVLYLPWFLWAWSYYGSPVPHTVTAKGSVSEGRTVVGFLQTFVTLPVKMWTESTTVVGALMPTYYQGASWPTLVYQTAQWFGLGAMVMWLIPGVPTVSRISSLVFHGGNAYLTYFPYFPFPWYFPILGLFAAIVWAGVFGRLLKTGISWPRWAQLGLKGVTGSVAGWFLVLMIGLLFQSAIQMEAKQRLVYDGNLRRIGEWLKEEAAPGERVFLEPLGYIGYFSQMATDDYPGLSCPRMVAAREEANNWSGLLMVLTPEWVVLRPPEAEQVRSERPDILTGFYEPVKRFERVDDVAASEVPDHFMLEFDSDFTVFRRTRGFLDDARIVSIEHLFGDGAPIELVDGMRGRVVHAPGTMVMNLPESAKRVTVHFGMPSGSYDAAPFTDGAVFNVSWQTESGRILLASRSLDPAGVAADRGIHSLQVDLPVDQLVGGELVLHTQERAHATKDWAFWGEVRFE